jgi:hypothetical protein
MTRCHQSFRGNRGGAPLQDGRGLDYDGAVANTGQKKDGIPGVGSSPLKSTPVWSGGMINGVVSSTASCAPNGSSDRYSKLLREEEQVRG